MKILECKRRTIYDIGFIDPYIVNEDTLQKHPEDTEDNLLRFLKEQNYRNGNTISLQLQVSVTVLYTFYFCLLDVKCN